MRLYVDGELVQETSIAADTLDEIGYFLIGTPAGRYYEYENASNTNENTAYRQGWAMRGDYVGLMDDVRIYNRILSDNEVEALYQSGTWARSYSVLEISPVDGEGTVLTELTGEAFTAKVKVQKGEAEESAIVILAVYDKYGRMLEVYILDASEGEGDTFFLECDVANRSGDAAEIRAFLVPSLTDPVPTGAAVVWPGQ